MFYSLVLLTTIWSCSSDGNDPKSSKSEKKITKRDFSIKLANAYNDIFLDSMAMVDFITENKLDDTLARRITGFYNARNYQYAWFSSHGLSEQGRGFYNMYKYHLTYTKDTTLRDKSLIKKMDELVAEDTIRISSTNKSHLITELNLTRYFLLYAINNIEDGYVKRKELEKFVPIKKVNAIAFADSLLKKKHKDNKYYEEINEPYKLLKVQLSRHVKQASEGGWPVVNFSAKEYKSMKDSSAIIALKRRLYATGDLLSADLSGVANEQLTKAIKHFQNRHGFKPDGKITDDLIREMNVPITDRIQQILINMGRMQWIIQQPEGRSMVVNLPEFMLHVKEGNKNVIDMVVVVGKEGHNTTMFTGNLNQVVFSPYWNIPINIVKKEILPAMEKNSNYLAKNNMEIVNNNDGIPTIRQLPGEENSLGKVKFLFPNSYDIYFHDTPAKSLFQQSRRAYSHGCIRLSDPMMLAEYLLKDDPSWTKTKIEEAMNSNEEKNVKIKDPVPVLITYYTSWVDNEGLLHFAPDIYGHDEAVRKKMFYK